MKIKRDLLFLAFALAVVGGLYYLSTKGEAPPLSAAPPEHLTVKTRAECLQCHTPEKMAALEQQRKHPVKWKDPKPQWDCLQCHNAPKAAAHKWLPTDKALAQFKIQK